jgi:hypothetical protein
MRYPLPFTASPACTCAGQAALHPECQQEGICLGMATEATSVHPSCMQAGCWLSDHGGPDAECVRGGCWMEQPSATLAGGAPLEGIPTGWICPICRIVWAPHMDGCPNDHQSVTRS